MPYTAEVTRTSPTCVLFMIDQSRSMRDEIRADEGTQPKANGVAATVNRWLLELSLKCAKAEGVGDYYHVGVIGYGKKVGPALVGKNAKKTLVPISEIANNPGRVEKVKKKVPDANGKMQKQVVNVPIWFDAVADGATPMCKASDETYRILEGWVGEHSESYPPLVIHITDGEATDGDPEDRVAALRHVSTSDGSATLFNIHLSDHPDATPIIFPDSPDGLPDEYSKMLFETASPLTDTMRQIAQEQGIPTSPGSKAFVLNADMVAMVQAIDIGTRPSNVNMDEPVVDPIENANVPEDQAAALMEARTRENAGTAGSVSTRTMDPVHVGGSDPARGGSGGTMEPVHVPGSDPARTEAAAARTAATAVATTGGTAPGGRTTVRLSVLKTGKLVEATFQFDKKGKVVGMNPVVPLDPETEYRVGPGK